MKRNQRYAACILAAALAAPGSLLLRAQAPAPSEANKEQGPAAKKEQPVRPPATAPGAPQAAPAQKAPVAPTGIQTLPISSARDSVRPEEVVLTIGPEKITRERFEQIKKGLPQQYSGVVAQMGEKPFATNYGTFRGLAMMAEGEKMDQSAEFKEQLNFMRMEALARMAISSLQVKSQIITEPEVKAYYDAHPADFQQTRLKGIFVALNPPVRPAATPAPAAAAAPGTTPAPSAAPTPAPEPKTRTDAEALARAQELRKQILAGGDLAAIAKASSDHTASAEKGGDFGLIRKNQLPANLDKVVFSLKPKEVSEPVKESQGYYVFQVEGPRTVTLDEANATIRNTLQQQKFDTALKNVQAQYPVVFNDRYFSEPAAASGGGARPVITGVAPGQPAGTTPAPPPAAKKP